MDPSAAAGDGVPDVSGRVLDSTGNPVRGAEAWLLTRSSDRKDALIARSDELGRLRFSKDPGLVDDLVELIIDHPEHPPTRIDVDPDGPPFAVVLPPGFILQGTITDPDGDPLPDVELEPFALDFVWPHEGLDRRAVRTDANGRFRITGLPPGEVHGLVYPVPEARKRSLRPWTVFPWISGPIEGRAEHVVDTGLVHILETGGVRGRVVGENGVPYADVEIHLETRLSGCFWSVAFRGVRTDSKGEFVFEDVPPGRYHLVRRVTSAIRTNKYHHADVTVRPGRTVTQDVTFPGYP